MDEKKVRELVLTLCLYADLNNKAVQRRNAVSLRTVKDAETFLAPLISLLDKWPTGFEAHVLNRVKCGNASGRTLNTLLGPWYVRVRKTCTGNNLDIFLKTILSVARHEFDGTVGRDGANAIAQDVTGLLRLPDAARFLGVSRDVLKAAAEKGHIVVKKRRSGTRGVVYEIDSAAVSELKARRALWISEADACAATKLPPSVIEAMARAEVINWDSSWRKDVFKAGPLELYSLNRLQASVDSGATACDASLSEGLIKWSALTSRRMGDKAAIQSLMRAIAAGDVRAAKPARHLGDFAFFASDVKKYFGTPLLEAGMSIQELARSTGWKWESIDHWIGSGALRADTITLRGQPCRVISPQQLLAFRQSYVPLADLARAMGTKASALAQTLVGIEIIGALTLPNGSSRGGLLRMADVGRWVVRGVHSEAPPPSNRNKGSLS